MVLSMICVSVEQDDPWSNEIKSISGNWMQGVKECKIEMNGIKTRFIYLVMMDTNS